GRPDRIQGAAHGFAAHVAVQCAQLSAAHAAGVGRRTESIAVRRSHDDTELGVPCVANLVLLQAESADRLLCGLLDQSAGGRDDRAHRADRAHRVPQSELRLDAMNASRRWTAVARRSLHCVAALILSICMIAASADSPEELTVTGRYPGPPLWKVSAGTHELLIFGTLPVIPKDITWGSVLVERAIARADEVLLPPGVDAAARNPFRYVGLFFRVRKLTRNEDGAPLKDVLPADLYARYATIRERYDGPRSLEQERPVVVAGRLYA